MKMLRLKLGDGSNVDLRRPEVMTHKTWVLLTIARNAGKARAEKKNDGGVDETVCIDESMPHNEAELRADGRNGKCL